MAHQTDDLLITVCAECLRASCWQGAHPCDAWRTASPKKMRLADLRELGLEESRYWDVLPAPTVPKAKP